MKGKGARPVMARHDARGVESGVNHEGPPKPGREAQVRPSERKEASGGVTRSGLYCEGSMENR